eukprot:1184231-Prymnesium_polylepis.1
MRKALPQAKRARPTKPARSPLRHRMASTYDDVAKIAVVGPAGAGKTSLVQAFCQGGAFGGTTSPTFGVDFRLHTMAVDSKQL